MVSTDDFFKAQQPAAVLKHGVLLRYAVYFAGRAGSQTQGRVSFVDGYAGPGRYEDGTPGSPFLLLQAASESELFGRKAQIVLVEAAPDLAASLGAAIEHDDRTSILNDRFENVLDDVLATTAGTATLVFIDPFSIGIGHEQVGRLLAESQPGRPVDILYHFSHQAVARLAERVVQASANDPVHEMASRIDALMGPVGWRSDFVGKSPDQRSFQIAANIARKFAADVARVAGASRTTIDVRKRPGHLPIYSLSLITKDVRATWDFADMAGKAHVDWIERCESDDHAAQLAALDLAGTQTLFDLEPPTRTDIDDAIGLRVVPYLIDRIPVLLKEHGPLRFADHPELILGVEHGRARTTHVRTAIATLRSQGRIDTDSKGDFFMKPIGLLA